MESFSRRAKRRRCGSRIPRAKLLHKLALYSYSWKCIFPEMPIFGNAHFMEKRINYEQMETQNADGQNRTDKSRSVTQPNPCYTINLSKAHTIELYRISHYHHQRTRLTSIAVHWLNPHVMHAIDCPTTVTLCNFVFLAHFSPPTNPTIPRIMRFCRGAERFPI